MQELGGEEQFAKYYDNLKESVANSIKSIHPAWNDYYSSDLKEFDVPEMQNLHLQNGDVYLEQNAGKYFIALDIKR